jgi:hypothetical protein
MAKFIMIIISLSFISCSMNPHTKYVKDNQNNQWIEKDHVYRSLASFHEDDNKKKSVKSK